MVKLDHGVNGPFVAGALQAARLQNVSLADGGSPSADVCRHGRRKRCWWIDDAWKGGGERSDCAHPGNRNRGEEAEQEAEGGAGDEAAAHGKRIRKGKWDLAKKNGRRGGELVVWSIVAGAGEPAVPPAPPPYREESAR